MGMELVYVYDKGDIIKVNEISDDKNNGANYRSVDEFYYNTFE